MIKLYSQPACGQCKLIHRLLDQNKIEYENCQDIDYMKSVGVSHTPVLELEDGTRLEGKAIMDYIKGAK